MPHLRSCRLLLILGACQLAWNGAWAAPSISSINPPAGSNVGTFASVSITFSESVANVDAGDLFINGEEAQAVTGSGAGPYVFTFTQPPAGAVNVEFAGDNGIAGVGGSGQFTAPPSWSYILADNLAPAPISLAPAVGATVGALTRAEVMFGEPVEGVDAGDLLINGVPATAVSGTGAGPYVFTFAQPAVGTVNFTWKSGHGIVDLAGNGFAGAGWTVTRAAAGAGNLIINEIVAINNSAFVDADGDNEGWIEIYNSGTSSVNLTGWSLTNDADRPGMWVFPNRTLAAGAYLVVFASGKNRRPTSGELHTNFELGRNGGYLALFKPDMPRAATTIFDPYPEQKAGYSFGFSGALQRYFTTPTPGAANSGTALIALAAMPVANPGRGYYTNPFQLTLTTGTPGATIRYTTDGSEPTASTGIVYTGPVTISTTTVIRAAAFAGSSVPSPVLTHTYFFLDQVPDQPNNPAGFPLVWTASGTPAADYEMDKDPIRTNPLNSASAVDSSKLQRLKDGLRELPSISIAIANSDMFAPTGMYYHFSNTTGNVMNKDFPEKPCSVEMILPNGTTAFVTTCGLRIHGNASRSPVNSPKHSLKFKFKPEFGPGKLEYRLFPESAVIEYDDIVLRAEYNTSWRHWSDTTASINGGFQRSRSTGIRDQWIKDTMLEMGNAASHSRLAHIYINGLYFGIFDLTEDPSSAFAENFLGGQSTDYDVYDQGVLKEGTATVYNAMIALPNANSNTTYEQFKQYLDVPAFIDYMLLHFYAGHQDWGNNKNWAAIRRRTGGTFTTEGKFIYLPWDGECILLNTDINRVPNGGSGWGPGSSTDVPSGLHSKLDNNAQYRLDFADHVHKHLVAPDGVLLPAANIARWQKWQAILDKPVVAESCRWGDYRRDVDPRSEGTYQLYTREAHWLAENDRIANVYFPTRGDILFQQLRTAGLYPTLNAPQYRTASNNTVTGSKQVAPGSQILMTLPSPPPGTASNGMIYYTTDGSDPRVIYSGNFSSGAQVYTGPVTISTTTRLKARTLFSGTWSALNEALFTTDSAPPAIRITELMYNPPSGQEYEFIEIYNAGSQPVDLNGWSFTGVDYVFPPGSVLAPGSRIILAPNDSPSAWRTKYPGVTPFAYYAGNLSNSGEQVALFDETGAVVTSVTYDDGGQWPTSPDGGGFSLELIDPLGDWDNPTFWKASSALNGSPGNANSLPPPPVVTQDPQNLTAAQGSDVQFSVTAAGAALTYQWQFNDANLAGATSATLDLEDITPANEGNYRCIVSNPGGSDTSAAATLTITQTFSQWAESSGVPGASPGADPDGDGIANIYEFLHNLNPSSPSTIAERSAALPQFGLETSGGQPAYLTLTYRRNLRAAPGSLVYERSAALASWSSATPDVTENLSADPVTGDPRIKVKFSLQPGDDRGFVRMKVSP